MKKKEWDIDECDGPIFDDYYQVGIDADKEIINDMKRCYSKWLTPVVHRNRKETIRIPLKKQLRIALVKIRGGICERCHEETFDQVHHIDGDASNNDPSNLMLACYKCHKELDRELREAVI